MLLKRKTFLEKGVSSGYYPRRKLKSKIEKEKNEGITLRSFLKIKILAMKVRPLSSFWLESFFNLKLGKFWLKKRNFWVYCKMNLFKHVFGTDACLSERINFIQKSIDSIDSTTYLTNPRHKPLRKQRELICGSFCILVILFAFPKFRTFGTFLKWPGIKRVHLPKIHLPRPQSTNRTPRM